LAAPQLVHLRLDLARALEAAPRRVDGAERGAENFVEQRSVAEPRDPGASAGLGGLYCLPFGDELVTVRGTRVPFGDTLAAGVILGRGGAWAIPQSLLE